MSVKLKIWDAGEWEQAAHILSTVLNSELSEKVVVKIVERLRAEGYVDASLEYIQNKARILEPSVRETVSNTSHSNDSDAIFSVIDYDQIRIVYDEILDLDSDYQNLEAATGFKKSDLVMVGIKVTAMVYQMMSEPRTY